jgi:benzylsuccinate CoA-transferase BbsE subunit
MTSPQALSDLKVVDLAGPPGHYCTKLLADLGADVVRVEGNDEWLDPGPFVELGTSRISLYRSHFHTNKRSASFDLRSTKGRALLSRLLSVADILVESYSTNQAFELTLDEHSVRATHPSLVHVSITPFGRGTYSEYKAGDLVSQAMGGLMSITGFPDDPPMRVGAEQAYHSVGLHAAVGALLALAQRERDGQGRHVEVALQDALAMAILQTANFNFYTQLGITPSRSGNEPRVGASPAQRSARNPAIFECSDGWVVYTTPPNPPTYWRAFVAWLSSHGAAAELAEERFLQPEVRAEHAERILEVQRTFFATRTRNELYHEAQRHGLLCMPVQTVEDLLSDEQLRSRGYFVPVQHPHGAGTFEYPGAPYKLSETPFRLGRAAPSEGADTEAVVREWLGDGANDLSVRAEVPAAR